MTETLPDGLKECEITRTYKQKLKHADFISSTRLSSSTVLEKCPEKGIQPVGQYRKTPPRIRRREMTTLKLVPDTYSTPKA